MIFGDFTVFLTKKVHPEPLLQISLNHFATCAMIELMWMLTIYI